MKHDAIVEQGIPIHERVPIPEEMIPADSRVEIDAKIQAGYCMFHPLLMSLRRCRNRKCVLSRVEADQTAHSYYGPCYVDG